MTQFRKILLAGTASFALVATPVVAADVLGGATGAASGTASGAVDATGTAAGQSIQGAAEQSREAAESMAGAATDAASGAASGLSEGASSLDADGKGAVSSDTDAESDDEASTRGNIVSDSMAQMDTGGSIDVDTPAPPASGIDNAPAVPAAPGAPEIDLTSRLTEMGYTDIAPAEGSVASGGEASYTATNAEGQRVNVVVDGRTGAVVSEQPADEETQDGME